ncbi:MAG: hypothetical protein QF447_07735 [Candidatus Thioglobus sp.]|nr:hypothetical protein [Candidatus Thioglobus sp.]
MGTKVYIKHKESGMMKIGGYGFCWTYFFFGFFVPIFRGELGVGALHLIFTCVTFGVWQLIACFIYNKQYMTRMLTSGWELAGTEEENRAAKLALGIED